MTEINILVIEDNPADFAIIESMLRASAFTTGSIHSASRITEALPILESKDIGLVLLDLSLPDSFGIESFTRLRSRTIKIPVIILTGSSESDIALEALQQGAQDYLVKGSFKSDLLIRSIQYSIERKNAEEKILESEEKYRQMFYKNPFPALIYDIKSLEILEVNEAAIQKYGYSKDEFVGLNMNDIRATEDTDEWKQFSSEEIIKQKMQSRYVQHKKKNGQTIIAEITYYQINYSGKIAMQAQVNDVTEKLRLEKELLDQHTLKQRQITEAVLNAQEEERKRLGAELHDNVNQILATSKLYYEAISDNPAVLREMLDKGSQYISLAIQEIRKLSRELVSPAFTDLGLKHAIKEIGNNIIMAKQTKVKIYMDDFDEEVLEKELKLAIYRIIQEQVNNILKYANASQITITVKKINDNILLEVEDNGVGFDTKAVSGGIGIGNIQTRVSLFDGNLVIDSSPGKGCRLRAELPSKSEKSQRAA